MASSDIDSRSETAIAFEWENRNYFSVLHFTFSFAWCVTAADLTAIASYGSEIVFVSLSAPPQLVISWEKFSLRQHYAIRQSIVIMMAMAKLGTATAERESHEENPRMAVT